LSLDAEYLGRLCLAQRLVVEKIHGLAFLLWQPADAVVKLAPLSQPAWFIRPVRGFGCTGAHFNKNWGNADFRRMIVNAILWSAKVNVPGGGAKVELSAADLSTGLDVK